MITVALIILMVTLSCIVNELSSSYMVSCILGTLTGTGVAVLLITGGFV